MQRDRVDLGGGQLVPHGDGIAHAEDEPVGGGVQHEAHLVGQRGSAAGAVRGDLALVHLDQVFSLAAGTVKGVVELQNPYIERSPQIRCARHRFAAARSRYGSRQAGYGHRPWLDKRRSAVGRRLGWLETIPLLSGYWVAGPSRSLEGVIS